MNESPRVTDLLSPGIDTAVGGRDTAVLTLDERLSGQVAAMCAARQWLPDTVYAAAWSVLQHRWLGLPLAHAEDASGPPGTACAESHRTSDSSSVGSWLNDVDVARRAAAAGSDRSTSDAEANFFTDALLDVPGCLQVGFATSVTDRTQAQVVLRAIADTASALVAAVNGSLSDAMSFMAPELSDAVRPTVEPVSIHARFMEVAARRGDAPAVVWHDGTMNYAALVQASDRVARALRLEGVQRGQVVALALPRGPDGIVALLGILQVGAAYLPLDARQPPDRLDFMLRDAGAALVIAGGDLRHALAKPNAPWRVIGFDELAARDASTVQVDVSLVGAADPAYVMYTSGSTGTPKGIAVSHRSVVNLVVEAEFATLDDKAVVLQAAPLGFDASTFEIWGALLNGGCCALHHEQLPTPAGLAATIGRHGVTVAWLTSALFNAVVDDEPRHLYGLTELLVGGEELSAAHVRKAQLALPDLTLINGYGPTECTTFTTTYRIPRPIGDARSIPIGRAIRGVQLHVLGPTRAPLPDGLVGELYVGGPGLALHYVGRPDLTAERFVSVSGQRLYRTGDLVRLLPDGNVAFLGRADTQVKVRGFRIETAEIESALMAVAGVKACAVVTSKDAAGNLALIGYVVGDTGAPPSAAVLRTALLQRLPDYMVPSAFVALDALPITVNGKLDRRALPAPARQRPEHWAAYRAPRNARERHWCDAFARTLGLDRVGGDDNFFDLGGNSLLALRVLAESRKQGGVETPTTTFFRLPTPSALAAADEPADQSGRRSRRAGPSSPSEPIAIIAMAGRFPGARDVEAFWRNLCAGHDGQTRFDVDSLDPTLDPAIVADPSYVPVRGVLDDVEWFDAAFFGMSPGEAALTDPQMRVFMEICWEALERAGYAPGAHLGPVGVFGGMHRGTYREHFIRARPDLVDKVGEFAVRLGNDADYLATKVAHRLDLTGPAMSINTACSTSLVAIGQAVLNLRAGQCDMALAGGVSIHNPSRSGHLHLEGGMLSPDGLTRSFDADAAGTTFSDGAAVLLLKRHADALRDGDTVYALVRDVAVNNDGRDKASFTAPSIDGQAALIAAAHDTAGVHPRGVSYVEAHGTATPLGDPIEVAALTAAFRRHTDELGFCRIGSVKSNVGHLVMAAGAAGVIKTALALHDERLPATIHFDRANPHIDLASSPFVVCDRLTPWPRVATPRIAGVSSFGVGGTNAHALLEEAPLALPTSPASGPQLLMLSARSTSALQAMAARLAAHLEDAPETNLADVAHTLQVGRSRFAHRMCVVAESVEEAVAALTATKDHPRRHVHPASANGAPPLVWMFPGQGSQYGGMGRALYASDPVFRKAFDTCIGALSAWLSFDLAERMFADDGAPLTDTAVTQPALFCLSYALGASLLESGVPPSAFIGHSVGEFAAAVLVGVMSLDDAARLVALRGALMQELPGGSMLSVRLPLTRLAPMLPADLSLAAENGPAACVVAGPTASIAAFAEALATDDVATRTLHTSHAFHSWMMDGAVEAIAAAAASIPLSVPSIPIVSTLTGTWLTPDEALDPGYWARHLREPVRFSGAVRTALVRHPEAVFVEVGPREALSMLARQHVAAVRSTPVALPMLADGPGSELSARALTLGRLWTLGHAPSAAAAFPASGRRRVRLPTYPFERQRCWADPPTASVPTLSVPPPLRETEPMSQTIEQRPSRVPTLVAELRVVMEDVAGQDLSAAHGDASFVELGLDSLTLTQAALQVKRKYRVAITFRQLMGQHNTLQALATYLDAELPQDVPAVVVASPGTSAPATPAVVVAAVSAATSVSAPSILAQPVRHAPTGGNQLLEQVIQQQMQLMSQQLALLGGAQSMQTTDAAFVPSALPAAVAGTTVATSDRSTDTAPAEPDLAFPTPTVDATPTVIRYDVKQAFGAIARIHTTPGQLNGSQKSRLDMFVRRYVERTAKSKQYTVAHRPHMADPRVVNGFRPLTKEISYQIVVERSDGSRVWDIDGNEYIDVLNGFGMNLFGWRPKFVNDAAHAQLDLGYEIGPQHPLSGPVCALICELTGNDRAALCNTGSEAVMAAMRIARTVTERSTVVLFSGSYHGTFDEVLVRAGRGGKGIPGAPGIMAGMFGDVLVLEYGTDESLEIIRSRADDIAAVVCEPVQSRRPDFQPREFLKKLRALTDTAGVCLVFDEVITGFRAHQGGVQALFGIQADLSCYGKVIGGGFAIGAVAGKRAYMDALDGGAWEFGDDSIPSVGVTYFAGTFVRHPITLAAAHASLTHLKEAGPQLQQQLNVHTAAFADELSAFCKEVGAPLQIRHFASLWRVSWLEDHPLQDLLFAMMRNRGIHILDNFPCFMTTAHTTGDIARIKSAFKESIAEMQEAGFLPARPIAPSADPSSPPRPNARLGRDEQGRPTWYIPDSQTPGKYLKLND